MLVNDGLVIAAGDDASLQQRYGSQLAEARVVDLGGRAVVPGFVDSHTHVVFGGSRVDEMERRCRGESYQEIAAAGGGIVRSVAGIRDNSPEEIARQSLKRLASMCKQGTTTCEIKTGYGLEPELELKHLEAIDLAVQETPIDVRKTFLAHVIPPQRRHDRAAFIDDLLENLLPQIAPRVSYCDVFVEDGAYTGDEAQRIIQKATALGLRIKLHVDQMADGGGASFAASMGALSADHLEFTNSVGAAELAKRGTVATILPGCPLFLGRGPWPDGAQLRRAGCSVAVATDCNPGSSHLTDLALCASIAATRCGLSLPEALWAITAGGAMALGLEDRGHLVPGERADFVVVDNEDWRALLYSPGQSQIHCVYSQGRAV